MAEERPPIAYEILPGKRPRKNESSVTTYGALRGLVAIGLYLRLSLAKTTAKAQSEALERQDATEAAKTEGANVTRTYCDPDHSGEKRTLTRPAFDLMVSDLKAGLIKGIAIGDIDRLTRRHGVLELLIEIYEANQELADKGKAERLYWYCYHDEEDERAPVDLRTAEGRREARKRVDAAYEEIQVMKQRQTKRHRQAKKAGRMVGARGFGYETTGEIRASEANTVRLLADAVDKGQTLRPILNGLGPISKAGTPLTHRTVQGILTGGRVAGYRVDKANKTGEWYGIALDENGLPIKGIQEPILEQDQWLRLRKIYREREVATERRQYLGTGTLRCKACRKNYTGNANRTWGSYNYHCPCGSYLNGPDTDRYLKLLVELQLSQNPPGVAAPVPWPKQAELEALEADREATELEMSEDPIGWIRLEKAYVKAAGKLTLERREWLKAHPVPTALPAEALVKRWRTGDPEIMRGVLRDIFSVIWVTKAPGKFNPDWLSPIPPND